jgi:hypothetical protein
LAYLLRKSKNCNKEESGKRIFGLMISGKKGVHFFQQGVLRKMFGYEAAEKKKGKKGLLQN